MTFLGKHWSEESKKKLRLKVSAENNGHWNDNVGYDGIHTWVNRNLSKPELCSTCKQKKKLEACNISGKYFRDLSDWKYLCRRCHMLEDGRMGNLKQFQ